MGQENSADKVVEVIFDEIDVTYSCNKPIEGQIKIYNEKGGMKASCIKLKLIYYEFVMQYLLRNVGDHCNKLKDH